ncbi:MAG TPA: hypothetical protein V6C81_03450 [Planktothrix sp.]|jgi:hypothetical protein
MKTIAAVAAFVAASAFCHQAMAATYLKQAFDANYALTSPALGNGSMRIESDGKGHVRTETICPATGKITSVTDYIEKKVSTVMDKQKMIMTAELSDNNVNVFDEESAKKAGYKGLGAKNIDGHPCHGFEIDSKVPGGKTVSTEEWIGDDTHYLVHSETTTPQGKQITALKKWSNSAPGDITKLPADYKEMKVPAQKPPKAQK